MPCNSDYMEPTDKEQRLKETAELYVYACNKLGYTAPNWITVMTLEDYPTRSDVVPALCAFLKNLTVDELEEVAYDAHSPDSRRLADWWEEHKMADQERYAMEEAKKRVESLREQALAKLTEEEKRALDLLV